MGLLPDSGFKTGLIFLFFSSFNFQSHLLPLLLKHRFIVNHLQTIQRRIVSLLLICLFTFSITPSIVLHNMLADHHDETLHHHHSQSNELAKAGANCHFDTLVCEASYLNNIVPISIKPPIFDEALYISSYPTFYSQHHFYAELRGPPAVV